MTTGCAAERDLAFRRVTAGDLGLVTRWITAPHVSPWWRPEDADDVGAALRGEQPLEPWLLLVDGEAVGYFQTYRIGDDGEYAAACGAVGVGPDAYGFDYLIGDPALIGRGLGTLAIMRFVDEIVFGAHGADVACAGPHPDNGASQRVLEKNGFTVAGDIDTSYGPERLMTRRRPLTR